jgi:hypothetical protein
VTQSVDAKFIMFLNINRFLLPVFTGTSLPLLPQGTGMTILIRLRRRGMTKEGKRLFHKNLFKIIKRRKKVK